MYNLTSNHPQRGTKITMHISISNDRCAQNPVMGTMIVTIATRVVTITTRVGTMKHAPLVTTTKALCSGSLQPILEYCATGYCG